MKQLVNVHVIARVSRGKVIYLKEYTDNYGRLIGEITITEAEYNILAMEEASS